MSFTPACLRWLEIVLEERYGLPLTLHRDGFNLYLRMRGADGEIRFDNLRPEFHRSSSDFPCGSWNSCEEGFSPALDVPLPTPGMAVQPKYMVEEDGGHAVVHYDILGLAYWMLSRLEEVDRLDLDSHGRFPAISSHAYRHGYLERPVVDEWLHILGQVIQRVWPRAEIKHRQFTIKVSHDVDNPSRYGFSPLPQLIRVMAGDVLKRGKIKEAWIAPWVRLNTRCQLHPADPYNTFDKLMDISEANNLKSAFYFICGRTDPERDADYEPGHPAIRELMRRIHHRGHEIGLHPSYATYQRPELLRREAERLKRICSEEGIEQSRWGGRMHYLRWKQPVTLQAWEEAGMSYDSTLGYADRPGFRCGTCIEYPAFDPQARQQLNVRIRPLIVMECTIIARRYMGLGYSNEARIKLASLKNSCKKVNGSFTLLWHNSHFMAPQDFVFYKEILR